MTLKELSQLYYLNREIEMDQHRLEELRAKAESVSGGQLSDMPKSPNVENRMERYVAEMVDLQMIVHTKQLRCIHERNRLERYISDIGDSVIRQVFTFRFINGLSWFQVAVHVGGGMTEGYARNVCYKYLKTTG